MFTAVRIIGKGTLIALELEPVSALPPKQFFLGGQSGKVVLPIEFASLQSPPLWRLHRLPRVALPLTCDEQSLRSLQDSLHYGPIPVF